MSRSEIDLYPQTRKSRTGSPLSTSTPLKTNSYKNEKRGLESGSSNLGNSRSGVMEHLKCYGAQEMVRYLGHSIARPHWLMDSRCRKDYHCVRVSSSYAWDRG